MHKQELQFKLPNLRKGGYRFGVLYVIQIYICYKFCYSLQKTVFPGLPARYSRDFTLFNVCFSSKNTPLLEALQLLILFAGMLTYLTNPILQRYFVLNKILIECSMNMCRYIYSRLIMVTASEIVIIAQATCFDLCVRVFMNPVLLVLIL